MPTALVACFSLLMRTINENKQPRARQQQHQHHTTPNMYIFIKIFFVRNHFSGHLNENFLV